MKKTLGNTAERLLIALFAMLNFCITSWAAPPGPPAGIPSVPVGNAGMGAVTIVAVAAYGYWKCR